MTGALTPQHRVKHVSRDYSVLKLMASFFKWTGILLLIACILIGAWALLKVRLDLGLAILIGGGWFSLNYILVAQVVNLALSIEENTHRTAVATENIASRAA